MDKPLPSHAKRCPKCGYQQEQLFAECPACGVIVKKAFQARIAKSQRADKILADAMQQNNQPSTQSPVQPPTPKPMPADNAPRKVSVVDIDMPFFSMVGFMVKVALAAIPALIIAGAIVAGTLAILGSLATR